MLANAKYGVSHVMDVTSSRHGRWFKELSYQQTEQYSNADFNIWVCLTQWWTGS
jgi:hypothetical protein